MLNKSNKKDKYRSELFSKMICLYAQILKSKLELLENNQDFFWSNFSIVNFFAEGKGSILKFKILKELYAYWSHCIKIHKALVQSTFLKSIMVYIQ